MRDFTLPIMADGPDLDLMFVDIKGGHLHSVNTLGNRDKMADDFNSRELCELVAKLANALKNAEAHAREIREQRKLIDAATAEINTLCQKIESQ